jgi:hypothetical protein
MFSISKNRIHRPSKPPPRPTPPPPPRPAAVGAVTCHICKGSKVDDLGGWCVGCGGVGVVPS